MTMKSNLAQGAGVPTSSPSGRHTQGVDVANTMSVGAKVGTDVSLLSATPEKSLAEVVNNQTLGGRHGEVKHTHGHTELDSIIKPLAGSPDKKTLVINKPLAATPNKPFPAADWNNDFNTTALKDKFGEGDDQYLADFGVSQGCGHDYAIGILIDNTGNDRYISGVIAQGAGNDNGIGVLIDNGGKDEYHIKGLGQGRGNFNRKRMLPSFGIHFDVGGDADQYSHGKKNNRLIFKTERGIFADTR